MYFKLFLLSSLAFATYGKVSENNMKTPISNATKGLVHNLEIGGKCSNPNECDSKICCCDMFNCVCYINSTPIVKATKELIHRPGDGDSCISPLDCDLGVCCYKDSSGEVVAFCYQ